MNHIKDIRMQWLKDRFREEMSPEDKSRGFYVDHAGNALGFTIERGDGSTVSYNGKTWRHEPFEVTPSDGAVDIPPYDYKNGEIVSILSENPQENTGKYACYYARYFCGEFAEVITEKEYKRLEASGELYSHDTLSYEPIFDGKIYPTLSDSSCAQLSAFGYHYNDDRRAKPSLAEKIAAAEGRKSSSAKNAYTLGFNNER